MKNMSQSHTAYTSAARHKQQSLVPDNRQCKMLSPTKHDGNGDLDTAQFLVLSSQV